MKNQYAKYVVAMTLLITCLFSKKVYAGSWGFTGEGWYNLTPKCATGKFLDISGASDKRGTNIQIYEYNNTKAQRFYFSSVGLGNEYYVISSAVSNKVLDVSGNSNKSGANVQQWDFKYGDNQIWRVESAGNGYYYLKPYRNLNLALDVSGAGSQNCTNVQVYSWSKNNNAQMWKFWKGTNSNSNNFVSSVKTSSAKYNIKSDGNSKVTVWTVADSFNLKKPYKAERSKIRVKIIQNSTGKIITNKVITGPSYTFSVNKKYGDYTVETSLAPSIYWPFQAYYSMLVLENARIK